MKRVKALKVSIPIILIICLILFSLFVISFSSAKYTTVVEGVTSALTAAWNVITNADKDAISMVCGGDDQTYTLTVTTDSQVSCSYSIKLRNVPNDINVKIDEGDFTNPENNTVLFENIGSFNITDGINSRTHTVTFNVPLEAEAVTDRTINVEVIYDQID